MRVDQITIPCPCCGVGKVELATAMPPLAATLDLLSRVVRPVCTQILYALPDRSNRQVKVTAINNRLRALEKLGLVKSERRGKALYWDLVTTS